MYFIMNLSNDFLGNVRLERRQKVVYPSCHHCGFSFAAGWEEIQPDFKCTSNAGS